MSTIPMSPRLITVAVHVPAHVSDQEVATSFYRILRHSMRGIDPAFTYPDPATLEVHAATLTAEGDAEIRNHFAFGSQP